jgi:uncharacterized protein YodC (DUF2158 family)
MMQGNIEKGSTVVLRSGGPTMTVIAIRSPEDVVCAWFSDFTKVSSGTFPLIGLKLEVV